MTTPLRAGGNSPNSPNRYHPPSSPYSHHSSSHNRLLSASTFTYIASWRGQLLICTVVLVVGAVYFVIREPIERWRIRRKERLSSRAREALLKAEEIDALAASSSGEKSDTADGETLVPGGQRRESADREKDRGRKKDGAGKRRKSSVLKASGLAVTPVGEPLSASSIESSPAPATSRAVGGRDRKASVGVRPPARPVEAATPAKKQDSRSETAERGDSKASAGEQTPARPSIRLSVPEEDTASIAPSADLLDPHAEPHLVALPPSPLSQTSDLPDTDPSGPAESQAEHDAADEPAEQSPLRRKSDGFSIIPEEGYLPPPAPAVAGKKKKRKSKATGETKPEGSAQASDGRRHSSASTSSGNTGSPNPGVLSSPSLSVSDGSLRSLPLSNISLLDVAASSGETGPDRGRRSGTMATSNGSSLEDALREKERVIDALRAEIGVAKAEEGKAKAEADRLRGEVERERERERQSSQTRGRERTNSVASRREQELQHRIKILESSYTTALHHIMSLESGMGTPLSQQMPSSPFFPQGPQRMGSVSGPGTPYSPMGFPSPVPVRSPMNIGMPMHSPGIPMPMGGGMGMPSPGIMYPSPGGMLHPGFVAASSPSPLRRTSLGSNLGPGGMTINATTYDEHSNLAGPLSPGVGPGTPLSGVNGARGQTYPPPGSAVAGMYPAELGYGQVPSPMTGGMVDEPEQLDPEARAARRISIESSVLKKKPSHPGRDNSPDIAGPGASGATRASSEPIEEEPEGTAAAAASANADEAQAPETEGSAGLGIGPIESVPASFTGPTAVDDADHHSDDAGRSSSGSLSSHPTSPSRRLLTPSNVDLYPVSTAADKMDRQEATAEPHENGDSEASLEIPMFASLAHTAEQKREMARIREEALKRQRLRGSSLSVHSNLEAAAAAAAAAAGIESTSCA